MLRAAVVGLLVAALLIRALIPAGFMLAAKIGSDGTRALQVVVCTGHGPEIQFVNADGTPTDRKPAPDRHHHCAFSGTAIVAVLAVGGVGVVPIDFQQRISAARAAVLVPPSCAGPPSGSRAPPLLS